MSERCFDISVMWEMKKCSLQLGRFKNRSADYKWPDLSQFHLTPTDKNPPDLTQFDLVQPTLPWFVGPMGCQTSGLSEQWAVGPMGCRTNGLSDQWAVGSMGCRTNGLSDNRHGTSQILPDYRIANLIPTLISARAAATTYLYELHTAQLVNW